MTTHLLVLIVFLSANLGAYLAGLHAGKQDGFTAGYDAGRREKANKAFAVGYDRGKRESHTKEEPVVKRRGWSSVWIVGLATLFAWIVVETVFP